MRSRNANTYVVLYFARFSMLNIVGTLSRFGRMIRDVKYVICGFEVIRFVLF